MPIAAATPLSDAIAIALAQLVDDSQTTRRDPSHSDLEFQINRAGLLIYDPNTRGQILGKAKRIRAVLSSAIEHNPEAGGQLVTGLLSVIRGHGGFREESPNYVGSDAIANAVSVFRTEGYELSADGELKPVLLDNLSGAELTDALQSYVRRAKRGASDAALVTGTGKDLLEAVAGHILTERLGSFSTGWNFPMILGQVFLALDMKTSIHPSQSGEAPRHKIERAMYDLAVAINSLRNKEGIGHGRPWLPSVTVEEARIAVESMGIVSEYLLLRHKQTK
jgi:hypothetical protein